jgi:hypothetical protein
MPYDSGGLEILTVEECRILLGKTPIGRIVFTDSALPAIQPVNYVVADGDVVIRTSGGSRLATAVNDAIVAFEVDDFDSVTCTGWSVVVTGHARLVSGERELAELRRLPLPPWVPSRRDHYIRIRAAVLSGRRIPPAPNMTERPSDGGRRSHPGTGRPVA